MMRLASISVRSDTCTIGQTVLVQMLIRTYALSRRNDLIFDNNAIIYASYL